MSPIGVALLIVFVIGACVGIYALLAPRRRAERERAAAVPRRDLSIPAGEWTHAAGEEFSGLSESARCDMIFAVAALDHERPKRLLEYALHDPSEAVALAAAHALVRNGRRAAVQEYLAAHPGERTERIAQTLAFLDMPSPETPNA